MTQHIHISASRGTHEQVDYVGGLVDGDAFYRAPLNVLQGSEHLAFSIVYQRQSHFNALFPIVSCSSDGINDGFVLYDLGFGADGAQPSLQFDVFVGFALVQNPITIPPSMVRKWNLVQVRFDVTDPVLGNFNIRVWFNGNLVLDSTVAGAGGTYVAPAPGAGRFSVGGAAWSAVVGDQNIRVSAVGYIDSTNPAPGANVQAAEDYEQSRTGGDLVDTTAMFTNEWHVKGASPPAIAPGGVWNPTVGAITLTQASGATSTVLRSDLSPDWA